MAAPGNVIMPKLEQLRDGIERGAEQAGELVDRK
jgi:hypothetical protein